MKPTYSGANTDFRALAENSADIVCRVDLQLVILYISPSVSNVLGWEPRELLGKGPPFLIIAEDLPILAAARVHAKAHPSENPRVVLRMRRKDGATVWTEGTARVVYDRVTGQATETVIVIRDISARKALEDRLAQLAGTDSLTGLPNRRAFDEYLAREWLRTLRERTQMSLLILGLDHSFNDHGHLLGDDCLRAVAVVVREHVRATDIACRYGGEEIAVILPGAGADTALKKGEAVRRAVEGLRKSHDVDPGGDGLTASVGVATACSGNDGAMQMPERLLAAAERGLDEAKDLGRNRVAAAPLAPLDLGADEEIQPAQSRSAVSQGS